MNSRLSTDHARHLIEAALGSRKLDLILLGGHVVNVFTGEVARSDVGILDGRIAVVSADGALEGRATLDVEDMFLTPGLIDSHVHLESSMLTPAEFARAVVPLGTTAVVTDPHEIANVAGESGIREVMRAARDLPLAIYFMIPSCVPASGLETSGAVLDARDLAHFADSPQALGVAEMMNYPGVLGGDETVLRKIDAMPGRVVDGHAPGLTGRRLQAYVAAGMSSDHETTDRWEGLEKLRAGMYLMLREGSAARNLDDLADLIDPFTANRCLLCTDDISAADLVGLGHIDHLLRMLVERGVSPVKAVRMATLNAAQCFRLDRVGAIAPGYNADIAVFTDLADFRASLVVAKGEIAAVDGRLVSPVKPYRFSHRLTRSLKLPEVVPSDLDITAGDGPVRVIVASDGRITTGSVELEPTVLSGRVMTDIARDILKIVVVERHGKSGAVSVGLIRGFGLRSGAMASSVAHDAHNVVAVGVSDPDILHALRRIEDMQGGLVAVSEGAIMAELPLPIAGLLSPLSAPTVARKLRKADEGVRSLGCAMTGPFATLSFMCLSVVPELKITDKGLVDVTASRIVPLFAEEQTGNRRATA